MLFLNYHYIMYLILFYIPTLYLFKVSKNFILVLFLAGTTC